MTNESKTTAGKIDLPSVERIQQEPASATSIDDFFGKDGIFARLFATTLEQMMEAELTVQLGYEKHEAKGRGSGNSRNGKYKRGVRSSGGEVEVAVPRDRMMNTTRSCCTNTKAVQMNWKTKSSHCRPKGCPSVTSTAVCEKCTASIFRQRRLAR